MTRVCLIGDPDVTLQYELLSRETARDALSTYDLERPFENSLAVRTVSIGAAVSLCNDLQWYIVRFVDDVLIQQPSVSETEWLSRELAELLRNGDLDPSETGEYLKIYGVERPDSEPGDDSDATSGDAETEPAGVSNTGESESDRGESPTDDELDETDDEETQTHERAVPSGRLVEPLYVRRSDGEVPAYDLRDVDDTVVVRLTEAEYAP